MEHTQDSYDDENLDYEPEFMNCLAWNLNFWDQNRDSFSLYYDSDHVIALRNEYTAPSPYLPFKEYGINHMMDLFLLSQKEVEILKDYMEEEEIRLSKDLVMYELDLSLTLEVKEDGTYELNFRGEPTIVPTPIFRWMAKEDTNLSDFVEERFVPYVKNTGFRPYPYATN